MIVEFEHNEKVCWASLSISFSIVPLTLITRRSFHYKLKWLSVAIINLELNMFIIPKFIIPVILN